MKDEQRKSRGRKEVWTLGVRLSKGTGQEQIGEHTCVRVCARVCICAHWRVLVCVLGAEGEGSSWMLFAWGGGGGQDLWPGVGSREGTQLKF